MGIDRIKTNDRIEAGQFIKSQNGVYHAVMHRDGRFSIHSGYPYTYENTTWSTNTNNTHYTTPFHIKVHDHGNVVLYDSNGSMVWTTNTFQKGESPHTLVMHNDGNLVLYDRRGHIYWELNRYQ